ncbi:MAG: SDR family NAD(P)-dependent oxidoreductase [Planctomycetota bacterium]|nr:SDR family NAD(P)-dependent oxidoreductase [Planctomycetota bacterium]
MPLPSVNHINLSTLAMQGLNGKRVLITGAAQGIGLATARRFAKEGCRLWLLDIDGQKLDAACAELGDAVEGKSCVDVASPDAVIAIFLEIDKSCDAFDILINNAGISTRAGFLDVTLEEWRRVLDVNLTGLFVVAQEAARRMRRAGSGVILNMGSMNGIIGCPNYSHYNASKAGVIELTKTMALELAPEIRVAGVCPGAVLTPMQEAEYTLEMFDALNKKIPMGRHATPEEIAGLFAFLASDEGTFICGTSIVIDGGESSGGLASAADEEL